MCIPRKSEANLKHEIGQVQKSLDGSSSGCAPLSLNFLSHFIAIIYMFVSSLHTELLQGRED